jgi:hypothetical protein
MAIAFNYDLNGWREDFRLPNLIIVNLIFIIIFHFANSRKDLQCEQMSVRLFDPVTGREILKLSLDEDTLQRLCSSEEEGTTKPNALIFCQLSRSGS